MQVQIKCEGIEHSHWMNEFIIKRVMKLTRYLHPTAIVIVDLRTRAKIFHTELDIYNLHHHLSFESDGDNLYESFNQALTKTIHSLILHKRIIKERLEKRDSSLMI